MSTIRALPARLALAPGVRLFNGDCVVGRREPETPAAAVKADFWAFLAQRRNILAEQKTLPQIA
jgi:hypothetical protein